MDSKDSKQVSVDNFALARLDIDINSLVSNSDLSYKIINNVDIIGKKIVQSKLDGCIIKNSNIFESDFSRCDINVARIENCKFVKVDFTSADIISSIFSNCEFIECDFEETHISDCDFINARFNKTKLSNCSFLNSTIRDANFASSDFRSSTIILNKYYDTSFNNMSLGDTTFEYHIMRNCEFNDVIINTDSLAYMYGCKEEQLHSVKLIFLGNLIEKDYRLDSGFFNELFEGLVAKHWYLAAILLKMNYKFISIYDGLNTILELFIKQDCAGFILKGDELKYVINILNEQHIMGELPSSILHIFIKRLKSINNKSVTKNRDILESLYITSSKLKDIQDAEIYTVSKFFNDNFANDTITAELVFKEKPLFEPYIFFSCINQQTDTNIRIVRERKGSYIVTIICTSYAIGQILKFIKYLTGNSLEIYKNGVIIKELLTNKEFRSKYNMKVLNDLIDVGTKRNGNQHTHVAINQKINIAMFVDVIKSHDCGGYNHNNLSKLDIIN